MNLSPLECLMEAKAARETVRDTLVKVIRRAGPNAEEVAGLLKADELAGENLRTALTAYFRAETPAAERCCQIPDSTTQHQPEVEP